MFFALLTLHEESPLVTCGLPSERANNAEFGRDICYQSEQAVE